MDSIEEGAQSHAPVPPAARPKPAARPTPSPVEDLDMQLLQAQQQQTEAIQSLSQVLPDELRKASVSRRATRGDIRALVSAVTGLTRSINSIARHHAKISNSLDRIACSLERNAERSSTQHPEETEAEQSEPPKRELRKRKVGPASQPNKRKK